MTVPAGIHRFIINPTSGGGTGVAMPAVLRPWLDGLGLIFEMHVTERPGHATVLAREAALAHMRAVIAVGGDGTIHEVANGLLRAREVDAGTPTALGLVPVGTGNDFVKVIDGTARRDRALETLAHGHIRWYDAGIARWDGESEYFVNAAGTGIDVEVVRMLARHRGGRGGMAYVTALVRALRVYRPIPVRIDSDGVINEGRVMMVAVANGRSIGGTFRICPAALPDDGRLDVCAVAEMSLARSIRTAASIVRGTHTMLEAVHNSRASLVRLSVPRGTPLFFQLDGELREPASACELTLEILPHALPVLAAPRAT